MQETNIKDGDALNAPFNSHEEYIQIFNERRERIYKRTGKKNFESKEYYDLILEDELIQAGELPEYTVDSKKVKESINDNDSNLASGMYRYTFPGNTPSHNTTNSDVGEKAVIVDPFTSDAPAGRSSSQDNLNVCVSCEG